MNNADFIIDNGVLIKYIGAGGHVVIPNSVTIIGNDAFSNCISLTSVTVGNSVTKIGCYAFDNCTALKCVILGDSLKYIDCGAFSDCISLTNIIIGDSVRVFDAYAFDNCTSIENVYYIGDIEHWLEIWYSNFSSSPLSYGANLYFNGELVTDVIIPNSVKSIRDFAFKGCKSLKNITIPDAVTHIGGHAFFGCTLLESVTIPNSVTSIECGTFSSCISLKCVTIPDSVKSIKESAFYGCSSLVNISIPNSVTSIGDYAFDNCTSLQSIIIPDSLTWTSIGFDAFGESIEAVYRKSNSKEKSSQSDKYVFISYSSKNMDYANATLQLLKDQKISAWMAPYNIPAGSKYAHVINDAIENCSCVLLLLSEESQSSEWVEKEIERAISNKKTVISMQIDESQLNSGFRFYLGNQQIVSVNSINISDSNVQKILEAIKSLVS